MRTRGERRRLTARAIKRKWRRYLQCHTGLIDGMYPSSIGVWVPGELAPSGFFQNTMVQRHRYHMIGTEWRYVHTDQHQPHRYNKKSIDQTPDHWPGRRHNMDWDAPEVSEWDGWDEQLCTLGTKWGNHCDCDRCAYLDYVSFDPFDDSYDLGEFLLWDDIAVDCDVPPEDHDLMYWAMFWEEE